MSPVRIQLRRTKGWRRPQGSVFVARPSRWGNPWRVGDTNPETYDEYDAAEVVALFRRGVRQWWGPEYTEDARRELAGKDLCCWCPLDQPCHADVLLEIANGGAA